MKPTSATQLTLRRARPLSTLTMAPTYTGLWFWQFTYFVSDWFSICEIWVVPVLASMASVLVRTWHLACAEDC